MEQKKHLLQYQYLLLYILQWKYWGGGTLTNQPSDSLNDIFERAISGKTLFINRNALRNEFIPTQIHFRDNQIKSVAQILSPALTGHKPSNQ